MAAAISVIVPARNTAATIGETLEAIARQDLDEPYEVIVVDDGSEDETVEIAERKAGPESVVRQPQGGAGRARNLGAERAKGAVLAFTDADCFPARDWLRQGLGALAAADLVQGSVRPDPGVDRRPLDRTLTITRETGLFEAANLFVQRDLFLELGGFEDWLGTDIGRPLGEDVWFGWRARRAGARISFCERALVHHAVFRRGAAAYVWERRRLAYFPALAARIPELREAFFYRRWFLSRRSAAFDLALFGLTGLALSSPLPLLAAAPYAWQLGRASLGWRRHAPKVALAGLAADTLSFAALAAGSVRHRSFVL